MWVDKEIIPMLIEAVKMAARDSLEDWQDDDGSGGGDYDPNDLMIFHGFVLPVLEESREQGFDSSDMLHKGFGFLMALIPGYLNRRGNITAKECFGKLTLLYYHFRLQQALSYLDCIQPDYAWENLHNINEHIESAKLMVASNMYPEAIE